LEIKTVIIDDELDSISSLELIINDYLPELKVIETFSNPLRALDALPNLKPDLLFLDISMPQMSGFELIDNLPELNFNIIFITAFDEYAIKAFRYSAIDYIIKPIDIDILIDAISKIIKPVYTNNQTNQKYDKLLEYINKNNAQRKITVSTKEEVFYILPDDIIYVRAEGSYAKIVLNENKPILVSKTLKDIEKLLILNNFFRVHKSYLINLNYVKKILKNGGGNIQMTNGELIPISIRKRSEFNKKIGL